MMYFIKKIKRALSRKRIKLGAPRGHAEGNRPSAMGDLQIGNKGFSLESDRVPAARERQLSLNVAKRRVRPGLLIGSLGALGLLIISRVVPSGGPTSGYDTQRLIHDYEQYRKQKKEFPGLPVKEEIQRRLSDAEYLENMGRNLAARRVWENILLSIRLDQNNPLYKIASGRVNDLK